MMQDKPKGLAGRPTLLEAEKLGDKILETAKELFFSQGYERTTIDQIATAAHVAKRTVYSRFASHPGNRRRAAPQHIAIN
jgi:TetR/AcrR family transcriptional repressor of mexJK operon